MKRFSVCIKSGTSGHQDYDNCDLLLAEITDCEVPHKNDVIKINLKERLLVTEVSRSFVQSKEDGYWKEYITVYGVRI